MDKGLPGAQGFEIAPGRFGLESRLELARNGKVVLATDLKAQAPASVLPQFGQNFVRFRLFIGEGRDRKLSIGYHLDLVHTLVYFYSMQFNIHQAKTHFSQLVDRALAGEQVIIAKNGKPIAILSPLRETKTPRLSGLSRGKGTIVEDFDAVLDPEILREFE